MPPFRGLWRRLSEKITEELARRATVDEVFATHIPGPDPAAEMECLLDALAMVAARP